MNITEVLTPLRHETDRTRIVGRLQDVRNAAVDVLAPQSALTTWAGPAGLQWQVSPKEPMLLPTGVARSIDVQPTRAAVRDACTRLMMPLPYFDRLATSDDEEHKALAATNIDTLARTDRRTALYRLVHCDEGYVLRAILSNSYQAIDNFDVLAAVTRGMTDADVGLDQCNVEADLTLDRFRLRIGIPSISVYAADLLRNYRSPYRRDGEPSPIIFAGIEVSNSETGGGAFTLAPRAVVLECNNGLTRPVEFRRTHLGAAMNDGGVVTWSAETQRRAIELISSQVADAVRTYCSVDFLESTTNDMRRAAGVEVVDVQQAVQVVQQRCELTDDETAAVLNAFVASGDRTALGLGQAVTFAAQHVESSDRQNEMELAFWQIVREPEAVTS